MMNDETEQFERRLSRQTLRQIPHEWRAGILSAAERAPHSAPRASLRSTLRQKLSTLFWPHPKAWAALAAIWVLIFTLNFSMRDTSPGIAEKSAPPSPEVIVELKKQQLLFAELMDPRETPDADRQKIFSPKPRSERVEILMT
jgi:hypothetical protein